MNKKILLQELAEGVARRANVGKKEAEQFVRVVFDVVAQRLESDKLVKIKGLGTFKLVTVDSRESVDVNTGERIRIKGHTKVSFTPDATLRDRVNKPFAQFDTVIINEGTDLEDMERLEDDVSDEETPAPVDEVGMQEEVEVQSDNRYESIVADEGLKKNTMSEKTVEESEEEEQTPSLVQRVFVDTQEVDYQRMDAQTVEEQSVASQRVEHQTVANQNIVQQGPSEKERKGLRLTLWGVVALLMVMAILMTGSYFAGYYRLLCPTCHLEPKGKIADIRTKVPVVASPVQMKSDMQTLAQKDSMKTQIDTLKTIAQQTDSIALPIKNVSQKSVSVKAESVPVAENKTTNQLEKTLRKKNEGRDSASYAQVEKGKYMIVGTRGTYTVVSGETLRGIARRIYGSKGYAAYIIVHNNIKNPDHVEAGKVLKLPELKIKSE